MNQDNPPGATPIDPDEMDGLKLKHITTRGDLDQVEQANIQSGLVWQSRSREKDILSERYIRRLHKEMFGEVWDWAGSFRASEKNIGVAPFLIRERLEELLGDMKYWIAEGTHAPQRAAMRFHHRLVEIHPFANGNGRHARIMADIILEKCFGEEPIEWNAGHDLQASGDRRTEYIAALKEADQEDYGALFAFAGI